MRSVHAPLILFALPALLVGVVGAFGNFNDGSSAEAADARPNIVVIMSDDQNRGSIQFMPEVADKIANPGVRFTQSVDNVPLCCPSRATFLTGKYAHNHGVWDNNPPDGGFDVFQPTYGTNNLGVWLQNAGYYTAFIGKYLNGYGDANPQLVPAGWNSWYGAVGDVQAVYDYQLNENGTLVDYGGGVENFKQDVFTGQAVSVVNERAGASQPFFLWVAYTAPHAAGATPYPQPPADCAKTAQPAPRHATAFDSEPLPTPPDFNETDVSDKPPTVRDLPSLDQAAIDDLERRYRCRLEALQSVDNGVGAIVDALAADQVLDNTLVIFVSDNGIFQGEHRIDDGKTRHYDAAGRVPLVMRGPGIASGMTIDDSVSNADLAPTILDAGDAQPDSRRMDSRCFRWRPARTAATTGTSSSKARNTRRFTTTATSTSNTPPAKTRASSSCTTWHPTRTSCRTWQATRPTPMSGATSHNASPR